MRLYIVSSSFRLLVRRTALVLIAACLLCQANLAHASGRKILVRVKPVYPPIAKRMKVTGSVLLTVTVEPNGHVKSADAVMGEHVLLEAARNAVEKWKFEPADSQTFEDVELQFPADAE
ncbi:energy transducer TonB [Telmatobacter bradus]|uniref:energy transducer TonB n=1 Tax=Telmatobacter bradus TaxID=474953 RepID=UPI003B428615